MEEWIHERGYVMWLGALGAAAAWEGPREGRERSREDRGERASASKREERPTADEAWQPR